MVCLVWYDLKNHIAEFVMNLLCFEHFFRNKIGYPGFTINIRINSVKHIDVFRYTPSAYEPILCIVYIVNSTMIEMYAMLLPIVIRRKFFMPT